MVQKLLLDTDIRTDIDSDPLRGYTHWRYDAAGQHQIAATVDVARFFDHFFAVFS